jgi:hypothetical protein
MWALAMGGWYRFDAALFQSFQPGDSTEKIWRKGNLHSSEMDLNWVTESLVDHAFIEIDRDLQSTVYWNKELPCVPTISFVRIEN